MQEVPIPHEQEEIPRYLSSKSRYLSSKKRDEQAMQEKQKDYPRQDTYRTSKKSEIPITELKSIT